MAYVLTDNDIHAMEMRFRVGPGLLRFLREKPRTLAELMAFDHNAGIMALGADSPIEAWEDFYNLNGFRYWFKEGQLHRDGGPAREFIDGCWEWFNHGRRIAFKLCDVHLMGVATDACLKAWETSDGKLYCVVNVRNMSELPAALRRRLPRKPAKYDRSEQVGTSW